jgi:hypothetical protein
MSSDKPTPNTSLEGNLTHVIGNLPARLSTLVRQCDMNSSF